MNEASRRPLPHMTADDFLAWPGNGTEWKTQLIDGEVYTMPPASLTHGQIQLNFCSLLRASARGRSPTLRILVEGSIQPRLNAATNIRVPDILGTYEQIERGQMVAAEPVLVVEILSPGSMDTTRENIRAYASLPSVSQMVVVHSTRILAEIHNREENGDWLPNPVLAGLGDVLTIPVASLCCDMVELYSDTWLVEKA